MTDQLDGLRWTWAAAVSFASITSSWHGWLTGENVITALGILVALLTVVERLYTIRIKRRQLRSPLDRAAGRHGPRRGAP